MVDEVSRWFCGVRIPGTLEHFLGAMIRVEFSLNVFWPHTDYEPLILIRDRENEYPPTVAAYKVCLSEADKCLASASIQATEGTPDSFGDYVLLEFYDGYDPITKTLKPPIGKSFEKLGDFIAKAAGAETPWWEWSDKNLLIKRRDEIIRSALANLQTFTAQLQKELNILKEREAKYGGDVPLKLLHQISDYEAAITLTSEAIKGDLGKTDLEQKLQPLLLSIWS